MSSIARLAMAAVFAVVGGCAALAADDTKPNDPNPPANPKIEVSRGDRWTYELRDDITDELKTILDVAVTDVTDSEIDTRVRFTNASTNAGQAADPRLPVTGRYQSTMSRSNRGTSRGRLRCGALRRSGWRSRVRA